MCYQVLFFVLYLFFPGVNNNNKYNTHKINTINGLIFTRFSEDFETFSKPVNYLNVSSDNTTPLKTRPGATVHLRPTLNTRLSVPENWLVLTELQIRSSTHFRRRPTTVEYSYVKKQRVFFNFFFFFLFFRYRHPSPFFRATFNTSAPTCGALTMHVPRTTNVPKEKLMTAFPSVLMNILTHSIVSRQTQCLTQGVLCVRFLTTHVRIPYWLRRGIAITRYIIIRYTKRKNHSLILVNGKIRFKLVRVALPKILRVEKRQDVSYKYVKFILYV